MVVRLGCLYQSGGKLDLEYNLKVESIVFPGMLDEDCERKGGVKDDPKFLL